jgi:uncharacterized protein YjcR
MSYINDYTEDYYTTADIAVKLQLRPATICKWIRERKITGKKICGEWRVKTLHFNEFVERYSF